MRRSFLTSARARIVATAATVFALVALGGLTATPAYAVGTLQISVTDASTGGAAYAGPHIYVGATVVILAAGTQTIAMAPGTYIVKPTDDSYFNANTTLDITDGATTTFAIELDKYHATGTIPSDVGADTTVSVEVQNGGGFDPISGTEQTIPSGDSAFDVRVPWGPNTYRLKFQPASGSTYFDTYSAPFSITVASQSQAIGYTAFGTAGTITGSVLSSADSSAVTGATVYAEESGSVIGSTTVAPDGSYVLSFGATSDVDVLVHASAAGFVDQYYDGVASSAFASTVSLTSANSYSASGINFSMVADLAEITGNLTKYGGSNEPSPADIYLYKFDAGTNAYIATPYGTELGSADFTFSDLPDGSYRLAFRDGNTDQMMTWQIRDRYGSPVDSVGDYGACTLDFGVSGGADVQLPDIEIAQQAFAGYCSGPPYASGSDKTVTGTVLNVASLSPTVYAKLYQVASGGGFSLIDIAAVNSSSGDFSLSGVRDSGDYFIQFAPDASSSYLPTLLGDAGFSAWARDDATVDAFAAAHAFAVDVTDDATLSDHDVTLVEGALVTGTIMTGMGDAIHGKVVFTSVADSSDTLTVIGNGNGSGAWHVVLPIGGTYTMRAVALEGTYASEYWEDATRLIDADPIGPLTAGGYGEYEFRLASSPPVISGEVSDASVADPITVHLYFKDELGLWRALDEQDSDDGAYRFDLNYDTGENDGLLEGDYRLRFEDSNGVWLAATEYTTGLLPSTWNAPVTGPVCNVDVSVEAGPATAVNASFDIANQSIACDAEPPSSGDVTGHFVWGGTVDVANRTVYIFDSETYDFYSTTTDVNGEFTFEDIDNGTWSVFTFPGETHVLGSHEYSFDDEFTFAGGADLGDLVPLRYGNVSGTISDWDNDTMAGATATVFTECGCGDWESAEPWGTVEIDEFGHFEAPGIGADGNYSVLIEPADNEFVPTFLLGGLAVPDAPFAGLAEQDYDYDDYHVELPLNPEDFVVISGTVFFGDFPLEGAQVIAYPADGSLISFDVDVQEDGSYELLVAPNIEYIVEADTDTLYGQIYDGINLDPEYDPADTGDVVEVGVDPIGDIDFALTAPEGVLFSLFTGTYAGSPGSAFSLNGVDVHLYKYVIDGWEEVDTQTSSPYADVASYGDGDYRLRFSNADGWLSIDKVRWENELPPYEVSEGYDDYLAGGTTETDACFLDFEDTPHGSQIYGDILLDDPTALSCDEETLAEHYQVSGSVVTTSTFFNVPVADQTVTLTNDATDYVITATTDVNGYFTIDDASPGTYTLAFPESPLANGGDHTYLERSIAVEVDGDEALDPIELSRFGNAEVSVLNWDATELDGTTAQVYILIGSDWTPIGAPATVDAGGDVAPRGIAVDGEYTVYFDYPTGFVDGFLTDVNGSTITFTATGEIDTADLETYAFVLISGNVHTGVLPVDGASVEADAWSGPSYFAVTDVDGNYSVAVPANATYSVYAFSNGLVANVLTTVVVEYAQKTGMDLNLYYTIFSSRVFKDDGAGGSTAVLSSTAHLYKKVTGGWQEVASASTFGPYLWSNLSGSYRMRFSDGADWLPISGYEWINGADTSQTSGPVVSSPSICYIDFDPAIAGAEYQVDVLTPPSPDVTCAAEPAVVAPPVTPGTSGSGNKHPATTTVADDETSDTEVPAATPSPEPSEPADAGSDDGAVDEPVTTSAPDFTWLFWASGILTLLILSGGAVFIFRRRG